MKDEIRTSGVAETSDTHSDTAVKTVAETEDVHVEDVNKLADNATTEVSQKSDADAENHDGNSSSANKNNDTDTNTTEDVQPSEEQEIVETETLQMQTPDAKINEKSDTADIGKVAGEDVKTDE